MKNYMYFENRQCEYYPCHKKDFEGFNCLFCFCPLYHQKQCLGTPQFKEIGGKRIKNCSDCVFPHKKENYNKIIEYLLK